MRLVIISDTHNRHEGLGTQFVNACSVDSQLRLAHAPVIVDL